MMFGGDVGSRTQVQKIYQTTSFTRIDAITADASPPGNSGESIYQLKALATEIYIVTEMTMYLSIFLKIENG